MSNAAVHATGFWELTAVCLQAKTLSQLQACSGQKLVGGADVPGAVPPVRLAPVHPYLAAFCKWDMCCCPEPTCTGAHSFFDNASLLISWSALRVS